MAENTIEIAVDVVSAYVSNNSIAAADLPNLLAAVYAALAGVGAAPSEVHLPKLVPAVPISKSVTADFIISLEDGKKFKSIKRHLQAAHGMTPAEYRVKWDLPDDYPMVAPNYAAARSALAKTMGLGQNRKKAAVRSKK